MNVHELPSRPPATLEPDRYLSRDELAVLIGCHVTTIDRMVKDGMPSHTFGRRLRRFRLGEVDAWRDRRVA